MGQRKVPLDQEPLIAQAYLDGASPTKVALKYRVTVTTIKRILGKQGVYPRPKKVVLLPKAGTPEYEKQVVELRKSGLRVRDIARRLKSATTTVSAVLQREDILPKWKRGENYKVTPEQGDEIERLYAEGQSTTKLGERFECNARTIANVLKRRGVQLRRQGAESAFGKDPVRVAKAVELHKEGWSQLRIGQKLGVSQPLIGRVLIGRGFATREGGSRHSQWKGGRIPASGGYMQIWVPVDHHFAAQMRTKSGYILEHRLVMAEHLGRPLTRQETVHHINDDKADNRIENLQLRKGRHGKHVAYRCADCGSCNVVEVPL